MILKAIIEDIKETWDTMKAIVEGEAKLKYPLKELVGTLDVWFKENWYLILIFIGFAVAGYYLGYMRSSVQCSDIIMNMSRSNTHQFILYNMSYINYTL